MQAALKEAIKSYSKEEIPVGAVIVKDGKIIARGHNLKETKNDTTNHAEIIAIRKASKKIKRFLLLLKIYILLVENFATYQNLHQNFLQSMT